MIDPEYFPRQLESALRRVSKERGFTLSQGKGHVPDWRLSWRRGFFGERRLICEARADGIVALLSDLTLIGGRAPLEIERMPFELSEDEFVSKINSHVEKAL